MDVSRPWAVIRSPIDMDVLRVVRGTSRPLTGREVARLVGTGSQPTVNACLRRLAEQGLVYAQEAGNAYLYTFNREHLAAPAIELLAGIRLELERRLRAEITRWEITPDHVSIFGSAARGDGDARSDIDVLVVRPARVSEDNSRWRKQLQRFSDQVHRWTGNYVAVAELSAADLRGLRRDPPPSFAELRRDAITLVGPEAADLLAAQP